MGPVSEDPESGSVSSQTCGLHLALASLRNALEGSPLLHGPRSPSLSPHSLGKFLSLPGEKHVCS